MKQFLPIMIVVFLIFSSAVAEDVDLSELSFDELRILQTQISQELTTRPEWKSVPVPAGFYQVGIDIPAGNWRITCGSSKYYFISVECGEFANESKTRIASGRGWQFSEMICQEGKGEGTSPEYLDVSLVDGYYLRIEHGQAIFSTPERIELGF